ncbi:Phosphoheptose isomerase [gamma proteobacterium HdN1]|nr:Phosphoheptose isomerase [gamma proteobacterium HdN1]
MNIVERVLAQFDAGIENLTQTRDALAVSVAMASETLVNTLLNNGKILCCGNGAGAGIVQHFAACMLNRYERERPALPVIALSADTTTITAIACDFGYSEIFSKQIRALGHAGDTLLVISASGQTGNIVQAVQAAHDREMNVIALTGGDGGDITRLLLDDDVELRVPSETLAAIQEMHLFAIHLLCDLIDNQLFGMAD